MVTRKRREKNYKKRIILCSGIVFATAAYFSLDKIEKSCLALLDGSAKFMGFYIKDINIIGTSNNVAALIKNKLGVSKNENIFKLSKNEIYENVLKVSWVKSAVVQKNLPNVINIIVKERVPIAIFQHDSVSVLIDEDGTFIEHMTERPEKFPIVCGENANKKAKDILAVVSKFEIIKNKLEALIFVRERRWDIVVSGIKVKLPEQDIDKALETLSYILKNDRVKKNVVKTIDLRTPNNIVLNGLKLKNKNKPTI
ncbi:MAG: cell division protein FtsQ/DivIB [Holosporales bacterium]|jgi:cell division protein FtsQ|nr:cell division protein FtsQ/DivIB [Holosporales bacterium]